ncbi:MAG: hypothetical protein L0214_12405 [candidate division NC10 bacterium]|nr:hypothetical protein [candidate division NC10 bacterium]
MHMIQDATSPPHTRDDPHPIHDGYEARVEELRQTNRARFNQLLTAPSIFPSPSIFTPTGDARAPVPIARLIDSDTYRGTLDSYATGGQVGLAEYTNGGYVSVDTIFRDFPLPRRASLGEGFFDPPEGTPGSRQYFPKVADGDPVPHFVAEGSLFEPLRFRGQFLGGFILDDRVYEDYAALLLPRAVGYSTGLLDYFFRGTLDFQVEASSTSPALSALTIRNTSAEAMAGTFTLYAEDANERRSEVASFELSLESGATHPSPLTFPAPTGVQAYVLVFQGGLGAEMGAVAGRFKRAQAPPNTFFVWHVKFHNDQFDFVTHLSADTFPTSFGGVQVVESFLSSGSHQGLRRHYLFFALVHDPNRPLPPLEVADLGVTAQLSPAPSQGSDRFPARPFPSGAVGIMEVEVPQLTVCDAQPSPRMRTVAQLLRSGETNHYLIERSLMGPPLGPRDTGILASDTLVTPNLTRVSFEQLQGIARELHPLLTPPSSFPQTATAYAVAQFDVPNVDNFTVSEGGNRCFDLSTLHTASVVNVAAMWDLESVTVRLRDGTTIGLSDEGTVGDERGLIKGLTAHDVFGAEYGRTEQSTSVSPFFQLPPRSFFQSFRHNPDDPFGPLIERRP